MGPAMIPNLDVDVMKTFIAIADLGSFARAAEEVNKTQSAVSMQMKRLEERIERPIFARDGRASKLTEDGQRRRPQRPFKGPWQLQRSIRA